MTDLSVFRCRRELFLSNLDGKAAVIPASSTVTHHSDCEYPFRQNSDFWYLTGFDEPDAIALFLPYRPKGEQFILFVHSKDPQLEVWNGIRFGPEGAVTQFNAEIAHPLEDFPKLLSQYLIGAEGIAFRIGKHKKIERIILNAWSNQLDKYSRNGSAALSLSAPCPLIHEMRLRKDSQELERLREAARISAEAHEIARNSLRPGMTERGLQSVIEQYFLDQGARGPAYNSIVAGGKNACILHYTQNRSLLMDGDLVLVDAGCSLMDYYNGDITRTYPINGKFTPEQKAIYEIVLAAQLKAISKVLPGENAENVHLAALKVIVQGLLDLGLLSGECDSLIEQGSYQHLFMHRTGHWLGLDVHDVGAYRLGEYPITLEPSMALTVEPGIYISDYLPVPKGQPSIKNNWKNIGIRIEDDVLVTNSEPEVITGKALKLTDQIER